MLYNSPCGGHSCTSGSTWVSRDTRASYGVGGTAHADPKSSFFLCFDDSRFNYSWF